MTTMSPKTPNTNIDQLLAQAVVLLQRQFLLTEHAIQAGSRALIEFENAVASNSQDIQNVFAAFNYAFALVDHLVRYRKIAAVIPRISQKSTEFRALESSLHPLTAIRNQFQQINNHIENKNSGPLLGSVCWSSQNAQFVASFNDVGRRRTVPGVWMDTQTGRFGLQFCYIYNDSYYDLEKAILGMREFQKYMDHFCTVQIDEKDFAQEDHFMALRVEFKLS